ncbi:MAG: hypothetical protein HY260_03545 [Chloroflexi bacterium]|nr:hypothetical protein [Chloroflexota bacterium]
MKSFLIGLGAVLVAAFAFELAGVWWAMPIAGAIGGYWTKKGGQGFLVGALGVTIVWGLFLAAFAVISPLGALLRLFAGVVELGDSLAFVPVALALMIAFLLGGLGGVTGALISQIEARGIFRH